MGINTYLLINWPHFKTSELFGENIMVFFPSGPLPEIYTLRPKICYYAVIFG